MRKITIVACLLFCSLSLVSKAEDTIKLAYIDVLSGSFAESGITSLRHLEYAAERVNARGGVLGRRLEVLVYDTQGSPRNAVRNLRKAKADGAMFVFQGNSSAVAHELIRVIDDFNRQDPDNAMLFLNFSAADPALTNENCSFWHFRFDPHAGMKVAALTAMIAADESIKRVYLINQDYGFGHAVARIAAANLAAARPDIQIVGNEFHPIAAVQDFSPHAQKILEADADAVLTGNWGPDFSRLVFALDEAGRIPPVFSLNGGGAAISEAIGKRGNDVMLLAHGGVYNPAPRSLISLTEDFRATYPEESLSTPRVITAVEFLVEAINQVESLDAAAIAGAMEGMSRKAISGNQVRMRESDHQIIEPIRISAQSDVDIVQPMDDLGYGMKEVFILDSEAVENIPHQCAMQRP